MPIKFSNNASSVLAASVDADDTELTIATGQGAVFPSLGAGDYFYLTLGLVGATEIVKVTARSGDTLTVVRAQEGTTGLSHPTGTAARLLITAAGLGELTPQDVTISSLGVGVAASGVEGTGQLGSLGVGTAASGTAGEIRATSTITSGFSDDRLKNRLGGIEGALAKVRTLSGFYYEANETALALGLSAGREVGVSAQQVQAVQPEVVAPAPVDEKYLTVRYERLVPLLIEAIKELDVEIQSIKAQLKG
jgi:hypothetical protein